MLIIFSINWLVICWLQLLKCEETDFLWILDHPLDINKDIWRYYHGILLKAFFHHFLTWLIENWLVAAPVFEMSENGDKCQSVFPKYQAKSALFSLSSLQPKDIPFTIIEDQKILKI